MSYPLSEGLTLEKSSVVRFSRRHCMVAKNANVDKIYHVLWTPSNIKSIELTDFKLDVHIEVLLLCRTSHSKNCTGAEHI